MTREEKDLLLRDLCARLPYDTIVQVKDWATLDSELRYGHILRLQRDEIELKPYLRPMSSMTEEEKAELMDKCLYTETEEDWEGVRCGSWGIEILDKYDSRRWDNPVDPESYLRMDSIDWLIEHHFDIRGLIPMDLALEAPEGMYDKKD